MNRVRNATEFAHRLDRLFQEMNSVRVPDLAAAPAQGDPEAYHRELAGADWLEHHTREFFVDGLLAALNWRLSPLQGIGDYLTSASANTMAGEAGVLSADRGTKRFLDYLGFDNANGRPLLTVEAKRPSIGLPRIQAHATGAAYEQLLADFHATSAVGSAAQDNAFVTVPAWGAPGNARPPGYLATVEDYLRGVQTAGGQTPRRHVLTNGSWLIIYTDPARVIDPGAGQTVLADTIRVYADRPSIAARATEIFNLLDYFALSQAKEPITPRQVRFVVDPSRIHALVRGVRLDYSANPSRYTKAPRWELSPLIFLMDDQGRSICVEPPEQHAAVSHIGDTPFGDSCARLKEQSDSLAADVGASLGSPPPALGVDGYARHGVAFAERPWVTRRQAAGDGVPQTFEIVTGREPHFVLAACVECASHEYSGCPSPSARVPVKNVSVAPRVMFADGHECHCAHDSIYTIKSQQVSDANRCRCGPRSAQDGEAFCEILAFDEFLCCRRCVFGDACADSEVCQHMPCPPVRPAGDEPHA